MIVALTSCSAGPAEAPDLPQSVPPSWTRKALTRTSPDCWNAEYAGGGSAVASICHYSTEAVAFDAVQRSRAEANTVKFQEGKYFVLIKWTTASQTEITALVRAIQKSLQAR